MYKAHQPAAVTTVVAVAVAEEEVRPGWRICCSGDMVFRGETGKMILTPDSLPLQYTASTFALMASPACEGRDSNVGRCSWRRVWRKGLGEGRYIVLAFGLVMANHSRSDICLRHEKNYLASLPVGPYFEITSAKVDETHRPCSCSTSSYFPGRGPNAEASGG